ncbi:RHS repeat-associated core domain-containing protein, partial [Ammonifex thiophilus]
EGDRWTCYVWGLGLVEEERDGKALFYHYDLRGSTVALTDEKGKVTDRFWYGPYGELARHEGKADTPFLYDGRDGVMTDPNGLCYMRARYYNPEIKRFVSRDVVDDSAREGQSLNTYAFVRGNPVNHIDPSGLVTFAIGFSVSGGAGIGTTYQTILVIDFKGNVGLAKTVGGGAYAGCSAGGGLIIQTTSAETIWDLEGVGFSKEVAAGIWFGGRAGLIGGLVGGKATLEEKSAWDVQ